MNTAPKRRVFYSFHYKPDVSRASQVRNIGVVEGNRPATDNDWEEVKQGGDDAIQKWIREQMQGKSCTIVLVGEKTAGRKWINYEITESWQKKMGVAGIYIHGLKKLNGYISKKGSNPFLSVKIPERQNTMATTVKCYNPRGRISTDKYDWIKNNLSAIVEEAIKIRNQYE